MNIRVCDYCGNRNPNTITLTNRPNDKEIIAELCKTCLSDIELFLERFKR